MASQLMALETLRSSSLSSSEPRLPLMKRPNGDWRLLPRERDRWRRLPRDERGDCLGSAVRACPGAVVDMVEPMVLFCFRAFQWFSQTPAAILAAGERFRGPPPARLVGASPCGATGRAVLRLCALYRFATAAKKRLLVAKSLRAACRAPRVVCCSAAAPTRQQGPREALRQVSR